MSDLSLRVVARAAFAVAGLHFVALIAMLVLLEPGLPTATGPAADRWAYVQSHAVIWWGGWLVWHAAAVALLILYLGLAGLWHRSAPIRCGLGVACATAGLAADLSGQALYVGLPGAVGPELFGALEVSAILLTGYVANGLYTVGGVALAWAGASDLPRWLLTLSMPIWVAGVSLSVASMTQSSVGQRWSTGVLMAWLVLWTVFLGRWLWRRGS